MHLSFTLTTLGVSALMTLLLGVIGLHGVLSYIVAGRAPEIGIRLALGASLAQIRRMVVLQGVATLRTLRKLAGHLSSD